MKNNQDESEDIIISSLREKGLYQYDNHHLYPKQAIDYMVIFINEILSYKDEKRRKYLEYKNNVLLTKIIEELREKNIKEINQKILEEIVWKNCKIKLEKTKRTNRAEHALYNIVLLNDNPYNVIRRLQNIDDWKLNEHHFRSTIAQLLVCAYIHEQAITPLMLTTAKDEKISKINSIIVENRNNGCNIKAKELMEELEITKEQIIEYARKKFLPPYFDDESQKNFWKLIPNYTVA